MKWRRGLILASIHFAVAVTLIVWELVPRYAREEAYLTGSHPVLHLAAYQEEETVDFSPCQMWRSISWQEKVLVSSELPAAALMQWNEICPAPWSIAGLIGIDSRHHSRAREIASSAVFCLLIALQWFLLGGFPLVHPRRWWLEPGACNTAATVLEIVFMTIGTMTVAVGFEAGAVSMGILSFLLAVLALLTWPVWVVLLVWKAIQRGRKACRPRVESRVIAKT